MFFREKHSKSGIVLQLLESHRNSRGYPVQRVVISLGNARIPREHWTPIAKAVECAYYGRRALFQHAYTPKVQQWIDSILKRIDRQGRNPLKIENTANSTSPPAKKEKLVIDGVLFKHLTHTNTTTLGTALVAKHAWDELKLTEKLASLGFNELQIQTAAVAIINRLIEPQSEHALEAWVMRTSLPDLLGSNIQSFKKDRYYRVSDALLEHKTQIEAHIRQTQRHIFNLKQTLFLYDLTNSHFEGVCKKNPKAKRGKNKQKRDDCPQIVVGIIFDREGFVLAHKVFEGTMNDGKSLLQMIADLQTLTAERDLFSASQKPLVVMDAGIATKANLALLREKEFRLFS
jgi:hypothetical protein